MIGLVRALRPARPARTFALLSSVGVLGFLLVSQTIRSVVMNNDLGWRAHTVSYLLLCIWGALALDELAGHSLAGRASLRERATLGSSLRGG